MRVAVFGRNRSDEATSNSIRSLVLGFDYGRKRSGHLYHSRLHHLRRLALGRHVDCFRVPHVLWSARLLPSGMFNGESIARLSALITSHSIGSALRSQLLQDFVQKEIGHLVLGCRNPAKRKCLVFRAIRWQC